MSLLALRTRMANQPIFSLCHTTARLPDGWRAALQTWYVRCNYPNLVEHIFVTDEPVEMVPIFENTIVAVNEGPKTCVAGWNLAAKLSHGQFLINVADDWFPCEHWDTELLKVIPDMKGQYVVEVDTGGNPGLLTFCMVTRAYYERYGYLLYPEYIGVYSDNDFTDVARRNGVVIDARHLLFEHKHPLYGKGKADEIHLRQGRPEAWDVGKRVYVERSQRAGAKVRKKIAVCLPGESYSSVWVVNWTQLMSQLLPLFDVVPIFGYSSNVYVTRQCMAHAILETKPSVDFALWIDDDNILSWPHLVTLLDDMVHYPEADVVAGWCWIQPDVIEAAEKVSAGRFSPDRGKCVALTHAEMQAHPSDLIEVEYTGFPAVLMRYEALAKAGTAAFAPVPNPAHPYGFSGEDTSFCINAREKGGSRIFIDRRVKVPHLKLRDAQPVERGVRLKEEAMFVGSAQ